MSMSTKPGRKAANDDAPEKRPPGRPPVPAHQRRTSTIRTRVTAGELDAFEALGGTEWLRNRIGRELAKQKKTAPAARPGR